MMTMIIFEAADQENSIGATKRHLMTGFKGTKGNMVYKHIWLILYAAVYMGGASNDT